MADEAWGSLRKEAGGDGVADNAGEDFFVYVG